MTVNTGAGKKGVALVIGVGPGLGAAVARRLAGGGYAVIGYSRSPEKHAGDLGDIPLKRLDAGDLEAVKREIEDAETRVGPVEVVVYNAMSIAFGAPGVPGASALEADFRVNVLAPYVAAQTARSPMAKRGRGCVIFTGGGLAFDPRGWPEGFSLSIGKAGLRSLAYSLHDAFKAESIRVGTVTVAGFIKEGTPFAPELIAEAYLKMIEGEPDPGPEIVFKGA